MKFDYLEIMQGKSSNELIELVSLTFKKRNGIEVSRGLSDLGLSAACIVLRDRNLSETDIQNLQLVSNNTFKTLGEEDRERLSNTKESKFFFNFSDTLSVFQNLSSKSKIFLVIGAVLTLGFFVQLLGLDKPSVCDCRKVMMYEDGAVDAAKRILGNSYGAEFMERSQRECGLKYWDDIDKWQKENPLRSGTPVDNAMEFFMEKCN